MVNKFFNKKRFFGLILVFILSFFIFASFSSAQVNCKRGADNKYRDSNGNICAVLLEPDAFVGLQPKNDAGSPLANLLTTAFNFGIAAAVILALVMVVWGGIIKMTTDSWEGQDDAKSKFENAAYGLGLALLSWVILYTINPCLVTFTTAGSKECASNSLVFTQSQVSYNQATGGGQGLTQEDATAQLASHDIMAISTGECTDQTKRTCTSLVGLPQTAVDGLIAAQSYCQDKLTGTAGCITVTGGTETGHTFHGSGISTVDISYNDNAIKSLTDGNKLTPSTNYNSRNTFICEYGPTTAVSCSDSRCKTPGNCHIHVQF